MIKKLRLFMHELMSREKAFTLVELLIVIAIIAILTVAFLPGALQAPAKARDAGRQKAVRDISAAVESYIAENNGTIPASHATNCFISSLVIASNFNPLPVDPKPQTVAAATSCNNATANAAADQPGANKYFYRTYTRLSPFYVVGARMEIQVSGNTRAVYQDLIDWGGNADPLGQMRRETAPSGGGENTAPVINANTPFFIVIGPR